MLMTCKKYRKLRRCQKTENSRNRFKTDANGFNDLSDRGFSLQLTFIMAMKSFKKKIKDQLYLEMN